MEREGGKQLNKQISTLTKTEKTSAKIYVCVCVCGSDPDAAPMSSVALTGVRAPLIKEPMLWQVASLPALVIGPLLPLLSPRWKLTHLILRSPFLGRVSLLLSLILRNVPVGRQKRTTL